MVHYRVNVWRVYSLTSGFNLTSVIYSSFPKTLLSLFRHWTENWVSFYSAQVPYATRYSQTTLEQHPESRSIDPSMVCDHDQFPPEDPGRVLIAALN
jgi:hypothetical protein